jgi:hypothetical protein
MNMYHGGHRKKESYVLTVLLWRYLYLSILNCVLIILLYFVSTWFISGRLYVRHIKVRYCLERRMY